MALLPSTPPQPPRCDEFNEYAVIDIGSNSFHMIVAREIDGAVQVMYQIKHHVRLAQGLNENGYLTAKTIQRGIDCLIRFSERIQHFPKDHVRIVATYALRVAKNNHLFLQEAAKILPYPIEIISGKEEARLIYLGVTHTVARKDTKLVIDIGGGSTEIAVGELFDLRFVDSRPMGCVTYTDIYSPTNTISPTQFLNAQLAAEQQLEKIISTVNALNVVNVYGTSGTIKSIRNILIDMGAADGIITRQRLDDIRRQLLSYTHCDEIAFPSLSDERKPLILAGVAILTALFNKLDIEQLYYCSNSLREGVLYEMIDCLHFRDIRQNTALTLSKQYNIDNHHADKVVKMSRYLFKQWKQQSNIDIENNLEQLLYWAAQLHEIGLNINYSSIHKHSAYILLNSNLPGFNQEQQLLLATLVRNHRKSLKHENIPYFNLFERTQVIPLIQLLRLAILINNQRQLDLPVEAFTLQLDKDKLLHVEMVIDQQVADKNQLILLDLKQEQSYWMQIDGWKLSITLRDSEQFK